MNMRFELISTALWGVFILLVSAAPMSSNHSDKNKNSNELDLRDLITQPLINDNDEAPSAEVTRLEARQSRGCTLPSYVCHAGCTCKSGGWSGLVCMGGWECPSD